MPCPPLLCYTLSSANALTWLFCAVSKPFNLLTCCFMQVVVMEAAVTRLAAGTAHSPHMFQKDMPGQVGTCNKSIDARWSIDVYHQQDVLLLCY